MNEKHKVLIVDDDASMRQMTSLHISDGYEVFTADSGESALEMIVGGVTPDIILLDISMPGMDGYETLAEISGNPAMKDVPVLFLTGLDGKDDQIKGLSQCGVSEYVTKPFDYDILRKRMELHINAGLRKRATHAARERRFNVNVDSKKYDSLTKKLSNTEEKILHQILLGKSNKEISSSLKFSYKYVKRITHELYVAFQVKGRDDLRNLFI